MKSGAAGLTTHSTPVGDLLLTVGKEIIHLHSAQPSIQHCRPKGFSPIIILSFFPSTSLRDRPGDKTKQGKFIFLTVWRLEVGDQMSVVLQGGFFFFLFKNNKIRKTSVLGWQMAAFPLWPCILSLFSYHFIDMIDLFVCACACVHACVHVCVCSRAGERACVSVQRSEYVIGQLPLSPSTCPS